MSDSTSRRQLLQALGLATATGLAGCGQQLEPEENNEAGDGSGNGDGGVVNGTEEGVDSDPDPEEEKDIPRFQDSGVLHVEAEDGAIGPEGVFDQGKKLEDEPDNYISLPVSFEELKKEQHFQQLQYTAEVDGAIKSNQRETLAQIPENIQDGEWIVENLSKQMGETWHGGNPENPFKWKEYNTNENYGTRYTESEMDELLRLTAHVAVKSGPSSGNDYIYADLLSAIEHQAGKETYMFPKKTTYGSHGLTWAIEKPSWKPNNNQETWIIETDLGEKQKIADLDEEHEYDIKNLAVFTEKEENPDRETPPQEFAWKKLGLEEYSDEFENITVDFHPTQEFERALEDPEDYGLMPFVTSSLLAGYIDENAGLDHENEPVGELPEFNGAHLDVFTDRIEYELAD